MAFVNPVVAGEGGELIRESIKSPDYVEGVSGWIVRRDGSAEFNNVVIRVDVATGAVIVGEDGGPQVVIRISPAGGGTGIIQFPTGDPIEASPPSISSDVSGGEYTFLRINSGYTDGNPADSDSEIVLYSGQVNTGLLPQVDLRASGENGTSILSVGEDFISFDTETVFVNNEIYVNETNGSGNYPVRVVSGRVNTGTNTVTLTAADQEITNTASINTVLENGVAYSVDVQIQTRQSVGTSAAGTQGYAWKLWDGAVGGTQLDATVETWNTTVGNNLGTVQFSFLINYAGVTGSTTLRLSCADFAGADTLQVQSNIKYFMLVKRVGDPAKILNL